VPPADFDFDLPPSSIAQYPTARRRDARLLVLDRSGGFKDSVIADFPALLAPGDLVVLNDTRVIPARLFGHKESGGKVEILIERVLGADRALAHIRASKAPRTGTRLLLEPSGELRVVGRQDDLYIVDLVQGQDLGTLLDASGHIPLPPYIDRTDERVDAERYQTVYAANPGAVAAPTAGLHFDRELLDDIAGRCAGVVYVTLHVGAGTFRPVRDNDIEAHVLHAEHVEVSEETCQAVRATQAAGGRIVAVGTTVTRALETAASGGRIMPYQGDTRLFIRPGYEFRVVDALLTNFHLPRSTLLMLVCAFGGQAQVMGGYRHAIERGYRFYSYGDAMWLERQAK
jgi:S-adenosylmethionine:tRNA ribosyltransferase-isomerase